MIAATRTVSCAVCIWLAAMPALAADPSQVRLALEKSIALLQKSDVTFVKNTGCISCHHESLTAMLVSAARRKGFRVDEAIARQQLQATLAYVDERRDRMLQGIGLAGTSDTVSYVLLGLGAEGVRPTPTTDAMARFLSLTQLPDGRWPIQTHRPPMEASDITVTATSLRAMKLYAPKVQRAEYDKRVRLAGAWLSKAQARCTEEKAFRVLGLAWADILTDVSKRAASDLRGDQRPDGGWAELPTLDTDAYSTGEALYALHVGAGLQVTDPVYERGVKYLLNTQHEDGSWFVESRAIPIQVYFESGFPHGVHQWISAAGTAWAALALTLASPSAATTEQSQLRIR